MWGRPSRVTRVGGKQACIRPMLAESMARRDQMYWALFCFISKSQPGKVRFALLSQYSRLRRGIRFGNSQNLREAGAGLLEQGETQHSHGASHQ